MEEKIFDYPFEVKSYIIRVSLDNYDFICNRNDLTFKQFFRDMYVKFWEVDEVYEMSDTNKTGLEILEIVDKSNYEKKDQIYLNSLKQKYIKEYKLDKEPDHKLSNYLFNNGLDNYRDYYKRQYEEFCNILDNAIINYETIFNTGKILFYDKEKDYILNMKRNDIWYMKDISDEMKCIFIILRDYIKSRIKKVKFNAFDDIIYDINSKSYKTIDDLVYYYSNIDELNYYLKKCLMM